MTHCLATLAFVSAVLTSRLEAQTVFGTTCAGASGVTPTIAVSGVVQSGQSWTLEVTAPGGIGLGYLAIGLSKTTASALGGQPLPIDFGGFFSDPAWNGCSLNVDPSLALRSYTFDPNENGGVATFTFPGFDFFTVFVQAVNIDPDFATKAVGVSQGYGIVPLAQAEPIAGMVAIAPGSFEMGSSAAGGAPYFNLSDTGPVHTVTISSPFWMGQYEVTQSEYEALIGSAQAFFLGPNRPMELVSWSEASAYCAALTAAESSAGKLPSGYQYRLPTEAEWEYACRAGTTSEFHVGDELNCSDAWFGTTFHPTLTSTPCGTPSRTTDVGGYAPNIWGLYDMHGNVWEWCLDSFGPYSAAPATDPLAIGGPFQVIRGGSWINASNLCRSASRGGFGANSKAYTVGFRVVLAPIVLQ